MEIQNLMGNQLHCLITLIVKMFSLYDIDTDANLYIV